VVGGEQDRGAEGGKLPDDIPGAAPRARVEAGRRLVEEKDPGVPDDAEGEIQPPLLPAGQRLDLALLLACEADERDHLADIARIRVVARVAGDRLAHGQVRLHRELLEHQPDLLAQLPSSAPVTGIEADDHDLALVRLPVALKDLQHRRLASAVRPEQGKDLPVPDGEAHPGHGAGSAVALPQVLYDNSVHGLIKGPREGRRKNARIPVSQSRQHSLPSISCITRHDSLWSSAGSSRTRTAPSGTSRAHSASSAARRSSPTSPVPARTSRCTRFLTTLPSGTRWKNSRGPTPEGSTHANREP